MRNFIRKYKIGCILFIIILLQLGYITYMFAFEKEGFHSDDGWSYQFANADYRTWIHKDTYGRPANKDEWIDSQLLRNFIEVDDDMRFDYDAVFYNMSDERNPPLHSILLHTVCSFFPNTFSWWYGYSINAFAFVAAIIALYFFTKELTYSKKTALTVCLFYGFTTSALNTALFLRGYSLLTVLSIVLAYIHCRMYQRGEEKKYVHFAALFVIMVLGSLDHYSFLMIGLCFTVIYGFYLLCKRRWQYMLLYGSVMASAVVFTTLLWPLTAELLASRNNLYGRQMPLRWEVQFCICLWTGEATGIPFRFPSPVFWAYVEAVLVYALLFVAAIAFLLRKEERFRNFVKKMRRGVCNFFWGIPNRIRKLNKFYILCFCVCLATLVIIAELCDIYSMGICSDRYLFFIMPLLSAIFVCAVVWLVKKFTGGRKNWMSVIVALLLIAALISNHIQMPCNYLFKRNCEGIRIEELTKGADVIVVTAADWHLCFQAMLLRNTRNFFMTTVDECMDVMDELEQLGETESPVYLIIECDLFRPEDFERNEALPENIVSPIEALTVEYTVSELVDKYSRISWATKSEHIQNEDSFCGNLSVWRLR